VEKRQIEEAVQSLITMTSKAAKERYLKDNFEPPFIDKLRKKVPMLLEGNSDKKKDDGDEK
jgi:hypothetical protein